MTKLLALVFIVSLQNAMCMENVAIKSLRLSLWYQGLESEIQDSSELFESASQEKKKNLAPELIEMAHKFSNQEVSSKK